MEGTGHPRVAAAAVAALIVLLLVGGTYWLARGPAAPPKAPDPVSVLIADFRNNAQDPVFDVLLEQALEVGAVAEADSEFDLCPKRRGEATAALLDDVPTYRVFAPIYYYQGRVHDELGSPGARDSYAAYLAIKQRGDEKGLVADTRKRIAAAR